MFTRSASQKIPMGQFPWCKSPDSQFHMPLRYVSLLMSCYAGCINVGGVTGLEVQMSSSNPLSFVYRTRSSRSAYWKGVSILYNLDTGSCENFCNVKVS